MISYDILQFLLLTKQRSFGRLGQGQDRHRFTPTIIPSLKGIIITQVACGDFHTGAITDTGKLYTWGKGDDGRLGHGDMSLAYLSPKLVEFFDGQRVIFLDCGYVTSAAITGKWRNFIFLICLSNFLL